MATSRHVKTRVFSGSANVPLALSNAQADLTVDFGVFQQTPATASITGRVFLDFNNNGSVNGPDSGLSGVTVALWLSFGAATASHRHRDQRYRLSRAGTPPSHESRSVAAMDWRHRAACRDEDPELFFPIGTSGPALLQVEQAKSVCRRCTAVDECLQWALETGQDAGVWGGMSEEERRAVKRRGGLRVRAHSL